MTILSVFEQVMGEQYGQLAAPIQRFHRLAGRHELHGRVVCSQAATVFARCLAWLLGAPSQASSGPIRFELDAQPGREVWTRHFPGENKPCAKGSVMRSTLLPGTHLLMEQLGPARLDFALQATAGSLEMRLVSLRFFGVSCPAWLMPEINATEFDSSGMLGFKIRASLGSMGLVSSYTGCLVLPQSPSL